MEGLIFIEQFTENPNALYTTLLDTVIWEEQLTSRKTASFGKAYNYPPMVYKEQDFLPCLADLLPILEKKLGFLPNNCLLNWYPNGQSKMGFHADQITLMTADTGVAIISLGASRALHFRQTNNYNQRHQVVLPAGSLLYMSNSLQETWQHALPKSNATTPRLSLSFRQLKLS
ncbi:MAG: alpha-ketoglutarate-dependent dioxygenase AlkB [Aureispira sp.]